MSWCRCEDSVHKPSGSSPVPSAAAGASPSAGPKPSSNFTALPTLGSGVLSVASPSIEHGINRVQNKHLKTRGRNWDKRRHNHRHQRGTLIFYISWCCCHPTPLRFFHILYHPLGILLFTSLVGILLSHVYISNSLREMVTNGNQKSEWINKKHFTAQRWQCNYHSSNRAEFWRCIWSRQTCKREWVFWQMTAQTQPARFTY